MIAYCRIGERSSHTWFVLTYLLGYDKVQELRRLLDRVGQPGARPHRALGVFWNGRTGSRASSSTPVTFATEGVLEDADVAMPGGGPECGGSVVVYLKG